MATNLAQSDDSNGESGEEDQDSYLEKFRTKSGFQKYLSYFSPESIKNIKPMPFRKFVGPEHHTTPRCDIVVWSLISLVLFFGMLCPATHYPSESMAFAFISVSGLVFTALSVSVVLDLTNHGKSKRRPPCLRKEDAHIITRRPQIYQKSRQHDTDGTPHHSLIDSIISFRMVSTTE